MDERGRCRPGRSSLSCLRAKRWSGTHLCIRSTSSRFLPHLPQLARLTPRSKACLTRAFESCPGHCETAELKGTRPVPSRHSGHGGGGHFGGMSGGHFGGMGGAHLPLPSLSQHGSVRGWAGCTVGFKFRRDETIWSSAVTYKHGLASPELGEARTAQCFRMHENVGGLGTAG